MTDEQLVPVLAGTVGRIYENWRPRRDREEAIEDLEREVVERRQAELALRHARATQRSDTSMRPT
jgi:hypothetical protein